MRKKVSFLLMIKYLHYDITLLIREFKKIVYSERIEDI
jgi:hypothetical protein